MKYYHCCSALTEKIVVVLPRMKCPHRLDPHQIQGLDFIHIFPVIQWLVKRAIETREEFGDYIRSYSVSQYNKFHTTPDEVEFESRKDKAVATVAELKVCTLYILYCLLCSFLYLHITVNIRFNFFTIHTSSLLKFYFSLLVSVCVLHVCVFVAIPESVNTVCN